MLCLQGVTFDTGGLDLKPPAGMKLMKKVGRCRAGRLVPALACRIGHSVPIWQPIMGSSFY
jgi:Cytosol aminopeptidase family, catalytic domain